MDSRDDVTDISPFDAVLLLSFGGPEGPDDVVPFLRNVTKGRGIPDSRLAEVGQHYLLWGGRSPINDQNRALRAAIEADFAEAGQPLPVFCGNRNWDPYLRDTLREMAEAKVRHAAVLVTSAYSSYSGCRQYREDLSAAAAQVPEAPRLTRLRAYFNHPGFLAVMVDHATTALADIPADRRASTRLLFVTHSVPISYNEGSGPDGGAYVRQHESVRAAIVAAIRDRTGLELRNELVYCSRSGAPGTPWLEPDINDRLREIAEEPELAVVAIPIGFVSDHMEVIYDLDTEAAATAAGLGIAFTRAATCGTDARFVAMVRDLVRERAARLRGEQVTPAVVGTLPAAPDLCVGHCCPNPRGPMASMGGTDDSE